MKKILLTIIMAISLFGDDSLNKWFTEKYESYKPYLISIENTNMILESGSARNYILLKNKYNEILKISVVTYVDDYGKDFLTARDCNPNIKFNKDKNIYELTYMDYCTIRYDKKSYQEYISDYMKLLENKIFNAINKTYKEPTTKEFQF